MIIGIDFDNTIIKYDDVFGRIAFKKEIISDASLKNKNDVKNFLISSGRENDWTELQGIVYGSYIMEAQPYENFLSVLIRLISAGHKLKIISHKTKYPFVGKRVDLQKAAMTWLKKKGVVGSECNKVSENDVFFCNTVNEKIRMLEMQKCDVFIDDLEKVLDLIDDGVKKILFAPSLMEPKGARFKVLQNWDHVETFLNEV